MSLFFVSCFSRKKTFFTPGYVKMKDRWEYLRLSSVEIRDGYFKEKTSSISACCTFFI